MSNIDETMNENRAIYVSLQTKMEEVLAHEETQKRIKKLDPLKTNFLSFLIAELIANQHSDPQEKAVAIIRAFPEILKIIDLQSAYEVVENAKLEGILDEARTYLENGDYDKEVLRKTLEDLLEAQEPKIPGHAKV